jgi:hypothetical protein
MELYQKVLIGILVIVLFYLIIHLLYKPSNLTASILNAKDVKVIPGNTLTSSNTNNYTYSVWAYIDDWNYKYGTKKTILSRVNKDGNPSPSIVLDGLENNLIVSVTCYNTTSSANKPIVHECIIRNIPIQKWTCIIVSLYGRTLDVYLEGKLVRTCLLPGVSKIDPTSDINITPDGGFSGFTSNVQYLTVASNPQQAYNIYKEGMGGNLLGDVMNKYKLKVSFLEDNKETSSFQT